MNQQLVAIFQKSYVINPLIVLIFVQNLESTRLEHKKFYDRTLLLQSYTTSTINTTFFIAIIKNTTLLSPTGSLKKIHTNFLNCWNIYIELQSCQIISYYPVNSNSTFLQSCEWYLGQKGTYFQEWLFCFNKIIMGK